MTGSLQTKNGKFYIVLNLYQDGKRKRKWIATGLPCKNNKRKAEQMLAEAIAKYEDMSQKSKEDVFFGEYIRYWLKQVEKRVDPVTMQGYRLLTERHILPFFEENKILLANVDRKMLQEFLDEKERTGRLDGKGGLSPKSVRELKNILNQTLNEAIRDDYIQANPCALLVLPAAKPPEAKFYSVKQLNELLAAVREEPLYPVIRTAIVYGLRRSEILGLKWDSIDFDNNTLHIRHTVVKVTKIVEKDKTKSKSSRRSFPLLPEMRDIFLGIKEEQKKNQKLFGKAYMQTDYVFCWPDGKPFSPDYITRKFSALLKKHGFEHICFHELRHSCASLLINQGHSLKDVQEWMGHSDITVTANIYGHLETQRKVDMANRMSDCIAN